MAAIQWWSAGLDDVPEDDAWIDEAERNRFASMRFRKRLDEAKLARYTAKATVARARARPHDPRALASITVRNASDGAPEVWIDGRPAGLVIGMTDRADWAVSAVLEGSHRIGCDLELVERRSASFVADYFTESEQRTLAADPNADLTANLIWSAKESALKVLRTGLRRPTRSVEVRLSGSRRGWNPLEVIDTDGSVMPGWWIRFGEFVLTMAAAVPTEEPVSLETPPSLATAVPSHTWLSNPLTKSNRTLQT